MITKMKKFTFLVYYKDYNQFLQNIRDLGVVHVAERMQGTPDNAELQESIKLANRITAAQKLLHGLSEEITEQGGSMEKGVRALDTMDELLNEKARLNQHLLTLAKEKLALEPWGDFNPESLNRLYQAGWQIRFYTCTESAFLPEWIDTYHATEISRMGSRLYFVTVTRPGELPDLEVESPKLPNTSLSLIEQSITDTEAAIKHIDEQLVLLAKESQKSLEIALLQVHAGIEFSKVVLNTEKTVDDKLMLLQGWAPASKSASIVAYLQSQQVYFDVADPTPEDNVPIELNNNGFFRLFEPIMRLYMLPKYNELDLTPFFAPFFMVFFGLCLGDSGYGLFMFLGAMIYKMIAKDLGASMKSILSLVQILGVSTFFCGMLTGTFFGFNLYNTGIPFFENMGKRIALDNQWMFNLSLIMGVVQILFGMGVKAANQIIQFGFKYAVATIGWIILLVSMIVAALLPSVLPMGETVHLIILGISALMIFLYNSPDKNIFVNIGLGFWDSYNMATGLLGDILSYVRLFALGLSGGILASVFNSLAEGMSPDNVIAGPIVMVLIFVIGHAINMFMNILGAMVHPMRLTFVEFFKNSGFEGGGKEYKPFKNIK